MSRGSSPCPDRDAPDGSGDDGGGEPACDPGALGRGASFGPMPMRVSVLSAMRRLKADRVGPTKCGSLGLGLRCRDVLSLDLAEEYAGLSCCCGRLSSPEELAKGLLSAARSCTVWISEASCCCRCDMSSLRESSRELSLLSCAV